MADNEGEGEGQEFDPGEFIDNIQNDMSQVNERLTQVQKENQEYKQTLGKMREAFGGETLREQTERVAGKQPAWLDELLDLSLQAEKQGRSIPMTTKIGVELAETQAEMQLLKQALAQARKENEETRRNLDPAAQANTAMFMAMDDALTSQIEKVYGEMDVGIYEAGVKKLSEVLNYVRREEPDNWENIRRNRGVQQQIVQNVVLSMIPADAQVALNQKFMDSEPINLQTFDSAAEELEEYIQDPRLKQVFADEMRIQYKELKYNGPYKYNKR